MAAAAAACKGNVRYTFRARGITTKWRTLEQRGGRRAGGKETRGRDGGNGRATEVLRGNERAWDGTEREGKRDGTGKRDRERKVRVADAGQEVRNLTERRARFEKCMGDDREPRARTARGPVSLTTLRF